MITTDNRALKFYQVPRHDDDGLLVLPRPRHGDAVAPDHVLLELHLLVIIKEHQHEITQAIACLVFIFALKTS